MRIVKTVGFEEVLEQFRQEHSVSENHLYNTNRFVELNLNAANASSNGVWHLVELNHDEILTVVLPWHISEGGQIELVPKMGLTVQEAVKKISAHQQEYKEKDQICWNKIERMKDIAFNSIFLSTSVPPDRDDYKDLATRSGLIHLDGLHRMISWVLFDRMKEGTFIRAYLAGSIS